MFKFGNIGFGALLNVFMLYVLFATLSHSRFKLDKMVMVWLPLLLILSLSILYTPYFMQGARSLLVVITYMAMFLVPFHFVKSKAHFVECIKIIIYSSLIPLVAVFYEFAFPAGSTNINGFRLFSTFNHPNVFAFYLVTIVSVCFFVIKSSLFDAEAKFRQQCWFILLFSLVCILGTKTRSAWAVVALLVFTYGIFKEKKYLVYLVIVSTIALTIPSIQERVLNLFQGNDPDAFLNDYQALNSYAWRKIIWSGALEKFWENPFLGFGYESFTYYSGSFFLIEQEKGAGAHNTYVQFLFEIGIFGFIAFLWLLIPLLIKLWELRTRARENIIVFTLFVSYCLIHYSDNVFDYLTFNWYFWFFIGAFLAYNRLEIDEK
jgi:O-antigen ligase